MSSRSAEHARARRLPVSIPRACRLKRSAFGRPLRVAQATWSVPLSNRLLVKSQFGATYFGYRELRAQPESHPRPDSGRRAVRERVRRQRQHSGAGLSVADFSDAYNGNYLWTE